MGAALTLVRPVLQEQAEDVGGMEQEPAARQEQFAPAGRRPPRCLAAWSFVETAATMTPMSLAEDGPILGAIAKF